MGFRVMPDGGAWTWTAEQPPLQRAVQAPHGSAFQLAGAFGLPFVRLRAALPEELLAGSVGHALGRRAGLSVQGLAEARDDNVAVMGQLARSLVCCGGGGAERIPQLGADDEEAVQRAPSKRARAQQPERQQSRGQRLATDKLGAGGSVSTEPTDYAPTPQDSMTRPHSPSHTALRPSAAEDAPRQLAGTALVFAFMSNAKTLPVMEYSRQLAAAKAYFEGVRVPGIDHDFGALHTLFLAMLSPGNLSGRDDWLEKSRLWRCVLLQRADGGWDLSASLAFALQAHDGAVPPKPPPRNKLLALLASVLEGDEEALDDAIEEVLTSDDDDEEETVKEAGAEQAKEAGGRSVRDCPLTFSRRAMQRRLPKALAALNAKTLALQAQAAGEARQRAAARALEAQRAAEEAWRRYIDAAGAQAVAVAVATQRAAVLQVGNPLLDYAAARTLTQLLRGGSCAPKPADVDADAEAEAKAEPPSTELSRSVMTGSTTQPKHRRRRHRVYELLPLDRIWATVLALSVLQEMDSSWILDDEAPEPWRTLVDAGQEWLDGLAARDRRLRALLDSGALQEAAERARKDWRRIQEANVAALRDTDVISKYNALTHLQRASARVVRSVMIDHGCVPWACTRAFQRSAHSLLRLSAHLISTFATFLDTDGYIMRWQRCVLLCSMWAGPKLTGDMAAHLRTRRFHLSAS
jgi:hypothetical protein